MVEENSEEGHLNPFVNDTCRPHEPDLSCVMYN